MDAYEFVQKYDIDTVEVSLADLTGALRGKRLPVRAFLEGALHGDLAFSSALFTLDYGLDVFEYDAYSWATGFPDIFLRPDQDTLRVLKWRDGTAFVNSDIVDGDGAPLDVSPRNILRRAVDKCHAAGYRPQVGLEAEFYLLDAQTRRPAFERNPIYSQHDGSYLEPVLAEIREALRAAELEVEACGAEYAPGQVEINLRYSDPVKAADDLLFFRYVVKQIAMRHGMLATFMAKPFSGQSGSGLHLHQSMWSMDSGRNLFWDPDRRGLSTLAGQYLGGLLLHAPDTYAVCVPTPNGHKRVSSHSFAPTTVTWGVDNRSTAVRALVREEQSTRLEYRVATSDANPYLAVAVTIAAGLYGIQENIEPPPAVTSDAYESGESAQLPTGLGEAVRLMGTSSFARLVLGDRATDLLAVLASREISLYEAQVGDWERARYLEAV